MELGFIGLGKMGKNMVTRLLSDHHSIVAYDLDREAIKQVEENGAKGVYSIKGLIDSLSKPRIVWIMVPAGRPTEETIFFLIQELSEGDTIIDGGNSYYKDSIERGKRCSQKGINFVDVGTSGGVWGLETGYCMMIGGKREVVEGLTPLFRSLAPENGYLYTGETGTGHYVKMIHNGIEYGMLQAYAEGFALLKGSGFDLDLEKISHLWNKGSIIRSWLLQLAEGMFKKNAELTGIRPYIEDSGEGRWTIIEAIERDIPCPVITHSLLYRLQSRDEEGFAAKVISGLRHEFGGHRVEKT